jgi:hypothetical protein
MGSKSELLRTLVAASSAKQRVLACPVLYRSGAPQPMKMGTIASPWRYDAGLRSSLQSSSLRRPAMLHFAFLALPLHPR